MSTEMTAAEYEAATQPNPAEDIIDESNLFMIGLHEKGAELTMADIDVYRYDCLFDGIIEHTPDGENNHLLLGFLHDALSLTLDPEHPDGSADELRLQMQQLEITRQYVLFSKAGVQFSEYDPETNQETDQYASPQRLKFMGDAGVDEFATELASKFIDAGEVRYDAHVFTPGNENAHGLEAELVVSPTEDEQIVQSSGEISISLDTYDLMHSVEGLLTLAQINYRLKTHPVFRDFPAHPIHGDGSGYRFLHPNSRAQRFEAAVEVVDGDAVNISFQLFSLNEEEQMIAHMFKTYGMFNEVLCPVASDVLHILDEEADNEHDLLLDDEVETDYEPNSPEKAIAALKEKRVRGLYEAGLATPEPQSLNELYGMDEKIVRIREVVEDDQYAETYYKMGLDTKKKVIVLAGESGTGKTSVIYGFANEKKPDVYLEIGEGLIVEGRHGESVSNVDAVFKLINGLAAEGKTVMLVCEEADTMLGAKTHGDTVNPAIERINNAVVNAIKTGLNRVHPNVTIFFTTNHFEALDPDIIAPHRVALVEMFDKPTKDIVHHIVSGKIDLRESFVSHQIYADGVVDALTHYIHSRELNPSAVKYAIDECARRYARRNVVLADIESMQITLNELLDQVDIISERFERLGKGPEKQGTGFTSVHESDMTKEDIWRHRLGPEFAHLIQ